MFVRRWPTDCVLLCCGILKSSKQICDDISLGRLSLSDRMLLVCLRAAGLERREEEAVRAFRRIPSAPSAAAGKSEDEAALALNHDSTDVLQDSG